MAFMLRDVPLIPQDQNMACWYASAQMLITWRQNHTRQCEIAHRDPSFVPDLVKIYQANNGLSIADVTKLAKELGLEPVPPQSPTSDAIENWLRVYGPIWFAGLFPSGHAVVITGVMGDRVHINDPWPVKTAAQPGGSRRSLTWQQFTSVLQPLGADVLAPNFLHFPD